MFHWHFNQAAISHRSSHCVSCVELGLPQPFLSELQAGVDRTEIPSNGLGLGTRRLLLELQAPRHHGSIAIAWIPKPSLKSMDIFGNRLQLLQSKLCGLLISFGAPSRTPCLCFTSQRAMSMLLFVDWNMFSHPASTTCIPLRAFVLRAENCDRMWPVCGNSCSIYQSSSGTWWCMGIVCQTTNRADL